MDATESTATGTVSYGTWTWGGARAHLEQVDPELHAVIVHLADPVPTEPKPVFDSLSRAIIGQQLSTSAAGTIWSRYHQLHQGAPTPDRISVTTAEQHRTVGISAQKHGYLCDLAHHCSAAPSDFTDVDHLSDEEIIRSWTRVRGLGRWTVQMHLMFQLGRQDVFPVDDLGVRRAMERFLGVPKDAPKAAYEKRARDWSPFRTAACRLLWLALAAQPK